MGAGVATSPHCPGSDWSAPKGQTLVTGRFGSPAEALLLRRVPFRETSARRLPSRWTSKKLGSARASHFFLDRPASRFLGFHLRRDVRRIRGGNGWQNLRPFPVGLFPATDKRCHANRFGPTGIHLWISRISGISPGPGALSALLLPNVFESKANRAEAGRRRDAPLAAFRNLSTGAIGIGRPPCKVSGADG